MKPIKLPGRILTVVIRDDSPFVHLGDAPAFRSVRVQLNEEQRHVLALRHVGTSGNVEHFESVSNCFIEPEGIEAGPCQKCGGSGLERWPAGIKRVCPSCNGSGRIPGTTGRQTCSTCRGTGADDGHVDDGAPNPPDCPTCHGSGEAPVRLPFRMRRHGQGP